MNRELVLRTNMMPLDTVRSNMRTIFSKRGWAIWVRARDGRFFSGNHVKGELQHSTFMAGHGVLCAGEWRVVDGKIEAITPKSGHYLPKIAQLQDAVDYLRALDVFAPNARAILSTKAQVPQPFTVPVTTPFDANWNTWWFPAQNERLLRDNGWWIGD